eukprot:SAG31_NODE_2962_length_4846_cov_3.429956_1_plen_47_part_00
MELPAAIPWDKVGLFICIMVFAFVYTQNATANIRLQRMPDARKKDT